MEQNNFMLSERSPLNNNSTISASSKVKSNKLSKLSEIGNNQTDNIQVNSLNQPLWFWRRHSQWSSFKRGIFWGSMISFTAIASALGGAASTQIPPVERAITKSLNSNSNSVQPVVSQSLTRPINILLIEIQPDSNTIIKSPTALIGNSKTILLLQFKPQEHSAKVINIPNDSRVRIPGLGWGTIADSYKYGGTALMSQMVSQMINSVTIDRYILATPQTFHKLTASGKVEFDLCDSRIQDCDNRLEQISRQQTFFETIRQHLNIPTYRSDFGKTIQTTKSDLDTNISLPEIMLMANYVGELEPEKISVDLPPGYIRHQK